MRNGQITDQAAAERFFADFAPALSGAVEGAFEDWGFLLRNNPRETAGLTRTARARVMHDRTVHRLAIAETSGRYPGLRVIKINGLFVVTLRDTVMLKLKKLDVGLRSRNIRTGQTTAFDHQLPLLGADFGTVTNATSGYVMDELGSEIVRLVIVCWDGENKQWEVDLLRSADESDGTVVTIPAGPAPKDPSRTRVVAEVPAATEDASSE